MKVTNSIYALAYAAAAMASVNYAASSAPNVPAPVTGIWTRAPQVPPATWTIVQPVSITYLPIVIKTRYLPVPPTPTPAAVLSSTGTTPKPWMPAPAPVPAYIASSPPGLPGTAVPANPAAQVDPSSISSRIKPAPTPTPTQSFRGYTSNKRDIDQGTVGSLVQGNGAVVFEANGESYILVRLPQEIAEKVIKTNAVLQKRTTEKDIISDATTKDLGSNSLLYSLFDTIVARIRLPVNSGIGISEPKDGDSNHGFLRREILDVGQVVASVALPVNANGSVESSDDVDSILAQLLGDINFAAEASPTIVANIDGSDESNASGLMRRNLIDRLLGVLHLSAVVPLNVNGELNADEDELLGDISLAIAATPTASIQLGGSGESGSGGLFRRNLLDDTLGVLRINANAPVSIDAIVDSNENGDGVVENLLGDISLAIAATPTASIQLGGSEESGSNGLLRRDILADLGNVIASVVLPLNVNANIKPNKNGDGVLPNLLGEVSLSIEASPTVVARINSPEPTQVDELYRRDINGLLRGIFASIAAPLNINANIKPNKNGDGVLPNLLGEVSLSINASPTIVVDTNGSSAYGDYDDINLF
ncbi:hypothetical protein BX661DRAFT_171740 [Kickxella alabastrina]|uniref:uncharacterized protein n=1 Tax=Kickxella alabastrina TaxID=61397 RepID=UPI00221F715A|nr:uncharacterized protein BX661DRAFT_171740 [Kickxella alabastrina]KAI7825766.1 hypothetical protein BX661DRAFT_171740 [Kickxella alabastrina]